MTERTLWASLWSYLWYLYTLERSVDRDRKRRRPSFVVFLNPTCDRYNLEKKCVKNRSLACLSTQSALVLLQSLYLNDQLYTLYIVLWNFSVLGHREVKKMFQRFCFDHLNQRWILQNSIDDFWWIVVVRTSDVGFSKRWPRWRWLMI